MKINKFMQVKLRLMQKCIIFGVVENKFIYLASKKVKLFLLRSIGSRPVQVKKCA